MTTQTAIEKLNNYVNLYVSVVSKSIKENIDGLKAGRLVLQLTGCPEDVINGIEKSMLSKLK
jgi:hypothetical protein